ncbi:MAG: YHS domain-containing protein [Geminicoccaceae bacterium]|nr:YHS domain-containing protein [Geminicoccaceae bacterium]
MAVTSRRTMLFTIGALAALALASGYALLSNNPGAEAAQIFTENDLAIRGYDPVAYFEEGAPVPGDEAFTTEWQGATWRFASAANRDAFEADPERYAPQYGGYCAWAVAAKGELYSTQPQNWTIVDDKLYLNYNDDVQATWEKDIPGYIAEGDRRWPEIAGES